MTIMGSRQKASATQRLFLADFMASLCSQFIKAEQAVNGRGRCWGLLRGSADRRMVVCGGGREEPALHTFRAWNLGVGELGVGWTLIASQGRALRAHSACAQMQGHSPALELGGGLATADFPKAEQAGGVGSLLGQLDMWEHPVPAVAPWS